MERHWTASPCRSPGGRLVPWRRRSHLAGSIAQESAQDLVEFAVILPVLLLLFFGIFEFGVVIYSYNAVANAAREGARYGIVHPSDVAELTQTCDAPANGLGRAACALTTLLGPAQVRVITVPPSAGTATVHVEYEVPLMTGVLTQFAGVPGRLPLQAEATMQLEQ